MVNRLLPGVPENGSRGTSVTPSLCKRVRFRKSDCQKCVDVCPEEAISLRPGPTIGASCTDCGLCQVACPTEAFENELCSELFLLSQVESLRDDHEAHGGTRGLGFHCRRAHRRSAGDLHVRCLGVMTENVLIGAAVAGFSRIVLGRGMCSRCHWRSAEPLINRSIRSAVTFARGMGLTEFCVQVEDRDHNGTAAFGRRDILSGLARRLRSHVRVATDPDRRTTVSPALSWSPPRNSHPVMGSPKRRLLKTIVGNLSRESCSRLPHDPEVPWGQARVKADLCGACGICAAVCPTGAISRAREGENHVLTFSASECTNCSLCQEACPDGAIDFEDDVAVAEVCRGGATIVAEVRLTSCAMCGGEMQAGNGAVCATCDKRQVSIQGATRLARHCAG
jgi:ferredoxin